MTHPTEASTPPGRRLTPERAVLFPCALALVLFAFLVLPGMRTSPGLTGSFLGAGGLLATWAAVLCVSAKRAGRFLIVRGIMRRSHYVQTCVQLSLLLYWGWYVRPVYAYLAFVVAQLVFAYGVDSLVGWTRRGTWQAGFGPVPIILSINFFLWFKPEWFYWQFVMVLVGFLAKDLIRWTRDGARRHIFNPSSFPLAIASLVLILTGTTDATLGLEVATTLFNPPHIYLAIALVALPGQVLFGVATMTLPAVLIAYGWGLAYFALTDTYYFRDAFIPIAVFLGMHLLFTDPSTAPRSTGGRVLFGILYGSAVIAFSAALEAFGAPTFYDKLLPIPLLNLSVRRIDHAAAAVARRLPAVGAPGGDVPRRRHRLVTAGLAAVTFLVMSGTGGVGDRHPGQYLPFWAESCEAGSTRACDYLEVMQQRYCDLGSGWACNELGISRAVRRTDAAAARALTSRGCELGFAAACENRGRLDEGRGMLIRALPELPDLPIVLRGSKGAVSRNPDELRALACERGWSDLCASLSAPSTAGIP